MLGRQRSLEDWQFVQAVRALRVQPKVSDSIEIILYRSSMQSYHFNRV